MESRHIFFANHQRLKATLAVRSFEIPHTGERILHIVKAVLQEWDIPCHQVGKILTDNGSNIVAKFDDVKPCKEAISTSKRLVARFNKSVKATEMLVKLSGKKLIGDCPTRWSSTYLLLKRLLAVRTDLETVICKLEWDGLQARHWKAIENVVVLLEPFAEYTSLCGGEEYTSISCVVPVLMELKLHLEKVN